MTIIDVNAAGVSKQRIAAQSGQIQIAITGTWSGATVSLQKRDAAGNYQTVHEFTEDSFVTVDVVREGGFQFLTTGSPTLVCDVAVGSGQIV